MRIHHLLGGGLGLVFASLACARAQNLITNPSFDHDLSGWTVEQGTPVWSAQDAESSPSSGSLATPSATLTQPAIVRSNCFAASPGSYTLEYKHRESGIYGVTAFLRWYSDASCSVNFANSTSMGGSSNPTWERLSSADWGFDLIAPAGTRAAALELFADTPAYFDDVVVERRSTCASHACLNDGRFAVSVRWFTATADGEGRPIQLTGDSTAFWFFDPDNVELVVKVLDGCAVNGKYWVFVAGLTDVAVEVLVTEVATASAWGYVNPRGEPFPPVQDTSAFATCP
ncbi:MAG TPA: hypothetical protein VGS57_01450 [Thermoanaerobaculia bacterium]|nr:hypothetical protein [Thermoanaerobaculia bacterium]